MSNSKTTQIYDFLTDACAKWCLCLLTHYGYGAYHVNAPEGSYLYTDYDSVEPSVRETIAKVVKGAKCVVSFFPSEPSSPFVLISRA